ncbi:MAG: gamma-glutamylcyclotransferase [Chloroflexaceae bacterium]|nr:gamma-glutamylcyclotransferase [Chloroflexaceae bacterium]
MFVYGTLKPGYSNYPIYLEGCTLHEESATLLGGALYTEGQYPYLVMEPDLVRPDERVQGVLITVRPDVYNAVLAHIDVLEDYVPGGADNWYERVVSPVQTASGPVAAWLYVGGSEILMFIRSGIFTRIESEVWHGSR